MEHALTLDEYLGGIATSLRPGGSVAPVITCLAGAAVGLAELIAAGPLLGIDGRESGTNCDGDRQIDIDVEADRLMGTALRTRAGCRHRVRRNGIAADPRLRRRVLRGDRSARWLGQHCQQYLRRHDLFHPPSVAGCAVDLLRARYGAAGSGLFHLWPADDACARARRSVDVFILDRKRCGFVLTRRGVRIPSATPEFAINMSNRRHWNAAVDAYIDHCLQGAGGEYSEDFNMRWIGSLVAEAYRILTRGGVFLYPADARRGYREGRLRLLYEAHPMALIIEQAGGAATPAASASSNSRRGAASARAADHGIGAAGARYRSAASGRAAAVRAQRAPLFARRGLFL